MRKTFTLVWIACWISTGFAKAVESTDLQNEDSVIDKTEETAKFEPGLHLKGFKFERNGVRNPTYHKEIFLGPEDKKRSAVINPKDEQLKHLKGVFKKADEDFNKLLSVDELGRWILRSARNHINASEIDASEKFEQADEDGNGLVSWDEYLSMLFNVWNKKSIVEIEKEFNDKSVDATVKKIMSLKETWEKMQVKPGSFDRHQFYMFLHPEASDSVGLVVNNIIEQRDVDGDGKLSKSEYVFGKSDNKPMDQDAAKNRVLEFTDLIDHNLDHYVTSEELTEFLKVDSESNAIFEAQVMMWAADANNDSYLSLDEILDKSEYFTGSKLCNYEKLDHQEL